MTTQSSRVSTGGEGIPRRVTPAEGRRLLVESLRAGRCDVARQAGWDLAVEEIIASLRRGGHAEAERAATFVENTFGKAGA